MENLYRVMITPDAEKDLMDLYDYIYSHFMDDRTAASFTAKIENAILGLAYMPTRFSIVSFEPWKSLLLRHFTVNGYIVYYIVRDDLHSVFVMNVIYSKRDQLKALCNDRDLQM
ncbi:MAG: type II toxin-antitoxin system RelE/ParE family toxin [Lactimicrobium sp.]|jgi:plasmid stabilization system protein ParE|uniref:type II toxin-antitoxin system RelE/ParE family toxin n=1 Tax=Lactimicrobium sp. TaxID=2563780 RepID=UPI002F352E8D